MHDLSKQQDPVHLNSAQRKSGDRAPAAFGGSISPVGLRLADAIVCDAACGRNRGGDGWRQRSSARQGARQRERAGGAAAESLVDLGADLRRESAPAAQPPQGRHVQARFLQQQLLKQIPPRL